MSLRDKILAATKNFRLTEVKVTGFPESLFIRPMSVAGMSRFLEMAGKRSHLEGARLMIGECLCDEFGVRVFAEDQVTDIDGLPSSMVGQIVDAINAMNATKDDAAENAAGN